MDITWNSNRCIVCLSDKQLLTEEHIIPRSLGGQLNCSFLCKSCNGNFGSKVESGAKSDPSIRLAVKHLRDQIPKIAASVENRQAVIANSLGGKIPGYVRNGTFNAHAHQALDGSLIQPTPDGRKTLQRILEKGGYDEAPILQALAQFDGTPDDERIEVAPGLEVVKWRTTSLTLDLSKGKLLNPLIPLKIAYEFIALHMGSAIYDEGAPLKTVRDTLQIQADLPPSIDVERLNAKEYQPFHGICFEGNDPHAKVLIRLFGWLAFRVHFKELSFSGPRFIYTHYLDSNNENMREL
jgi:hypothetical protein